MTVEDENKICRMQKKSRMKLGSTTMTVKIEKCVCGIKRV